MAKTTDGMCTTRCQLFNTEMTKNENKLRLRWFEKNREILLNHLMDDELIKKAREIRENLMENRRRRLEEDTLNIVEEEDKRLPVWRPPEVDGSINIHSMKPVDPSTRAIIYESGVESYLSGRNYLHKRYKAKPENRFYHPDCTSWLYGWRLNDFVSARSMKKFEETATTPNSSNVRQTSKLRSSNPDILCQCQPTNAKKIKKYK